MIGFEVTKVVFRGYYASPKLQALHDTAIQTRTQLKLNVKMIKTLKLFFLNCNFVIFKA